VADEVARALDAGAPIGGICLYPVLDYPGWTDDRHCETGLLGFADLDGARPVHAPLARELHAQRLRFEGRDFDADAHALRMPIGGERVR
ncbi:MAG TPA: hypothetical protein VGC30_16185, partial [Dokdonella sp.]